MKTAPSLPMRRYQDAKRLSEIFGFKVPVDGLMSAANGMLVIDVLKLDNILKAQFNYNESMNVFIKKQFGDIAYGLFKCLVDL